MKIFTMILLMLLLCSASYAQIKVILDTDMDSDVDDVAALAMLHKLVTNKQIELIGVIVTSDDPYAPLCADAINTYFGNDKIPVGFLKKQVSLSNQSKYTKQISDEFPHKLKSYKDTRESSDLYRELLNKSADNSVTVVTIGHLSSLQEFLESVPDKISTLSGKDLASKKVTRWICMGGMFPEGKEANFYRPDPQSTLYCMKTWPNPVVFSGYEVGKQIITGGADLQKELTAESPVYRAFQLYNNFSGRESWDESAVLLLMNDSGKYFDTVTDGFCLIEGDGSNRWIPGVRSKHSYITLKAGVGTKEIATLIESMLKK